MILAVILSPLTIGVLRLNVITAISNVKENKFEQIRLQSLVDNLPKHEA